MTTPPPSPPPGDDSRPALPGWAWALLAVVAVVGGAWLGTALDGGRGSAATTSQPWRVADAGARSDLSQYTVRTASGELVRLAAEGAPTVVMVSSLSCAVCKESLRDFAAQADASGLPRLRMVTLEGAAAGDAMLLAAGLTGLWHAGPANHAGGTLLTFQFPGTPTFLLLDGTGRVRAAMPGYPGRESFAPGFAVITGERAEL
jgi:hypothetical protein